MNERCVVLDIGGVLEITPATGWDRAWEERLGLPPGALDERLRDVWEAGEVGAITEPEVRARVAARLGIDAHRTDALMADLWTEYLGSPNEELIAHVRTLRSRCRLGILSNSFVGATEREEQRYHFGELVDEIVYSHEIGVRKPDPRAFEVTCERLAVRPADCLFVDDCAANIEAAEAFGMRAVLFTGNAEVMARVTEHLQTVESGPPQAGRPEEERAWSC
jgi:putative hydrolase of the HAD superfamily